MNFSLPIFSVKCGLIGQHVDFSLDPLNLFKTRIHLDTKVYDFMLHQLYLQIKVSIVHETLQCIFYYINNKEEKSMKEIRIETKYFFICYYN